MSLASELLRVHVPRTMPRLLLMPTPSYPSDRGQYSGKVYHFVPSICTMPTMGTPGLSRPDYSNERKESQDLLPSYP
ncbi:unnamed protein product [Cochlearia groenlandica]